MKPLAARIRPDSLCDFIGQKHLLSSRAPFKKALSNSALGSLLFWGPPGTGKTTLALLIAAHVGRQFSQLSAVHDGMAELRKILHNTTPLLGGTLLFVDEIHRWNKAQQDALLPLVESGEIMLIGATTENPSFSVNPALRSRCWILELQPLKPEELISILKRALTHQNGLSITATEEALELIASFSSGDGRRALAILERAAPLAENALLERQHLAAILDKRDLLHDTGSAHYHVTSAFIKSMRGSDPDAALYWLARMLEGGEDPLFIGRRMVIFASEDVGNADLRALPIAIAALQSVKLIGMPEVRIILGQCCAYLAAAPKSNACYQAINKALSYVKESGYQAVPPHLSDPPIGYKYPHDAPFSLVNQGHWPAQLEPQVFYSPKRVGDEKIIEERLRWFNEKKAAQRASLVEEKK